MPEDKWELVEEVSGELQAELLRGLLQSQGVPVVLNQEGAGRAHGLNIGRLGIVQILVPTSASLTARQVLKDYYAGKFEVEDQDGEITFEAGPDSLDED